VATGASEFVDKTIADGIFSPDIWSKKILAMTESNLVLANLFNRQFESDATVGKAVKIASIGNLASRAKTENTAITYETVAETVTTLTLNIWDYAAIGLEDIVEVQSNVNLRQQYEGKIGYALAQDVDTKLAGAAAGFTQTVGTLGTPFTDDNVRRANQYLDDADVPEEGRFMVMTPAEKNDKLGLDRWSNQLYRGGSGGEQVTRGRIGNEVYGLDPYVTTNLVKPSAGQGNNIIAHKDSYALVMQRSPKMHLFYDIDFFTWKVASEQIFGHGELRDAFGVWVKGAS
jgi:hypothetical protein